MFISVWRAQAVKKAQTFSCFSACNFSNQRGKIPQNPLRDLLTSIDQFALAPALGLRRFSSGSENSRLAGPRRARKPRADPQQLCYAGALTFSQPCIPSIAKVILMLGLHPHSIAGSFQLLFSASRGASLSCSSVQQPPALAATGTNKTGASPGAGHALDDAAAFVFAPHCLLLPGR